MALGLIFYSFSVTYLNTKPVSTIEVAGMEEHSVKKDTRVVLGRVELG